MRVLRSVFWSTCCLVACTSLAEAPPPAGLYLIDLEGQGTQVTSVDGVDVHLGRLLTHDLGEVVVRSTNNRNTSFHLMLRRAGPFEPDDVDKRIVLSVDGVFMRGQLGSSVDEEGRLVLHFSVWGEPARRVIEALQATPVLRRHPGHRLLTTWSATKSSYALNEPVEVLLSIENVGDNAVHFLDGGMYRGARNNQFGFTAFRAHQPLPDIGHANHFGGIVRKIELKPGEVFTKRIDLRRWFEFTEAGEYQGVGTFRTSVFTGEAADWPSNWPLDVAWYEIVAAPYRVRITQADEG